MKKDLNKILLEAVNRGIQFALDDFDEVQNNINTPSRKKDIIQLDGSLATVQMSVGQKHINQKVFIYELLKRLPEVNKSMFNNFGFINYKVTGDEKDWPGIISLNDSMSDRTRKKYECLFDTVGWTSINGFMSVFRPLLFVMNDVFQGYSQKVDQTHCGWNSIPYWEKEDSYWKNSFKEKFDDCVKALTLLAKYFPYLKTIETLWVHQISFSNDGAFIAITFEVEKSNTHEYSSKVFVVCTDKIINRETGLDTDESKTLKTKQRKFKNYLNKKFSITDRKMSNNFKPTAINGYTAFKYVIESSDEFDYRLRKSDRSNYAFQRFNWNTKYYANIFNDIMWIRWSLYKCYYIEDRYYNGLYDKLVSDIYGKPYVIVSSEDGKYLVAFYNKQIERFKYKLIFMIIDNQNYEIMPKDYLKEIEYNSFDIGVK